MTTAHRTRPAADPPCPSAAALVVSDSSVEIVSEGDSTSPSFAQVARVSPRRASGEVLLDAQLASALVVLARLFAPFVAAEIGRIRQAPQEDAWIDQESSALGRRMHCALARRGVLPARKIGRRWMVRRADLDAFIAAQEGGTCAPQRDASDHQESASMLELLTACDLALVSWPRLPQKPRR